MDNLNLSSYLRNTCAIKKKFESLTFKGTVKLHGCNTSIVLNKNNEIYYQSRNRVISPTCDHLNFCKLMEQGKQQIYALFDKIKQTLKLKDAASTIVITGEYCGAHIQKGVGISLLPGQIFVIFSIKIDDNFYDIDMFNDVHDESAHIYNISHFQKYAVTINFSDSDDINKAVDLMTNYTIEVGKCCPVAYALSKNTICGLGEGIVWTCVDDPSIELWFKTKIEDFAATTCQKTIPKDTETVKSINEFLLKVVTPNRLNQGFAYVIEMISPQSLSQKDIKTFLDWVWGDVVKEESDIIEKSGLSNLELKKEVNVKSKNWYMTMYNKV